MFVSGWTMRRFHITSLLVLVCARLTPCLPITSPPPPSPSPSPRSEPPAATPTEPAETALTPEIERIEELERDTEGEEGPFFQGDIKLLPYDDPYDLYRAVFKRMAFDREGSGVIGLDLDSMSSRLWPEGRVPYRFAAHLTMEYRRYFSEAVYEWSRGSTCLSFVPIGDVNITEENYLVLTDTAGCSSYVGMIGGPQEVSIDAGCVGKGSQGKGHAMHELGHAIGLWHEHSRWDRDSYIRIVRENIRDNAYYNFGTISQEKWPTIEDPGYDLLSIMHYGANSFSKNDSNTIDVVVRVPDCAITGMGQRRMLSRRDKVKISRIYQCDSDNETSAQDKCDQEPISPPPPTLAPPTDKLMNNDALRLKTNLSRYEYLFCSQRRCKRDNCVYNEFSNTLQCDRGFVFTIHHAVARTNQKIRNGDVVNLQSLHKTSRWLECSGMNICSISGCPDNSGNTSNISECAEQQFVVVTERTILKDGRSFSLKSATNETFLYCTDKWCDLLPQCQGSEVESDSGVREDVTCHSPTVFIVEKLYG